MRVGQTASAGWWGWGLQSLEVCRTTEEVLQQCLHACSQSQASQASELDPQGGRRGGGAGSREAWAPVRHSLCSAGEWKPEAFVSHRPSPYCRGYGQWVEGQEQGRRGCRESLGEYVGDPGCGGL